MDRPIYLEELIRKRGNGLIKVITGVRRCGKSYLLFELFYNWLLKQGVPDDHIIRLALDDRRNKDYRDPDAICSFIDETIIDSAPYYVLLDEVQMLSEFEDVLNSFLHRKNLDVYVTGSNAKFLSKDIITEFRGRGDQVHLYPFSFAEFMSGFSGTKQDGWQKYIMYGGLPILLNLESDKDKAEYLKSIFQETYLRDIMDRNDIRHPVELEELLNIISSSVGSLVNPKKLSDTFKSVKNVSIHPDTIGKYLEYLEDSFLISKARRFDVKGKKYISTPYKCYFSDIGLRNSRLNFRQIEETHLMENVIYNELLIRGYNVDVGLVEYSYYDKNKKKIQKQLEVDFVCNQGYERLYIQSALTFSSVEKTEQEQNSLKRIADAFKKIIIVKDMPTHYTEDGILLLNLFDFLLDDGSLKKY